MSLLVVQLGHVDRRTGAIGVSIGPRYAEQEHAIAVGNRIRSLMPTGWSTRLIYADEDASRYAGDAFIALHCDGSESSSAAGASVGYRNEPGKRLATAWKAAYAMCEWPYGFRKDNYTAALAGYYGTGRALQAGNAAAVIVEHGFLTNPTERSWIESPYGREASARAAVWAVTGRDPKSTPPPPPPEEDVMLPTLKMNDAGNDVTAIQRAVRAWLRSRNVPQTDTHSGDVRVPNADGVYGGYTRDAVAAYQRAAHLDRRGGVTLGVVDPLTSSFLRVYDPAL